MLKRIDKIDLVMGVVSILATGLLEPNFYTGAIAGIGVAGGWMIGLAVGRAQR